MKHITPKVSILMPVYNSEKFVLEAIDSILNQSFTDFEFIIVDDASTDQTLNIIKSFSDKRIKLIENKINVGNNNARNIGMGIATGEYICAMDADDIAVPNRVQFQLDFMEENKEYGMCGGFFDILDTKETYTRSEKYEELKVWLLSNVIFKHPTVFWRTSLLKKYLLEYNPEYRYAADYDLFVRAASCFPVTILPQVVLEFREHPEQITAAKANEQGRIADIIRLKQLALFEIRPTSEEALIHLALMNRRKIVNEKQFEKLKSWANFLVEKNNSIGYYESVQLAYFLKSLLKYVLKNFKISNKVGNAL